MQGLPDWVLGRPSAGSVDAASWDESGRLTSLQQDGWKIEYAEYRDAEGHQLPSRIDMRSPKLNLKLIIESWQLPAKTVGERASYGEIS